MEIPVLNQLEKIYPNKDNGAVAIRKLVKNQNIIEQGIAEINIEKLTEQINILPNDIVLNSGYVIDHDYEFNSYIVRNGIGYVDLKLSLKKDSGDFMQAEKNIVMQLPVGFRPKYNLSIIATQVGSQNLFNINILKNGTVEVKAINANAYSCFISCGFYA